MSQSPLSEEIRALTERYRHEPVFKEILALTERYRQQRYYPDRATLRVHLRDIGGGLEVLFYGVVGVSILMSFLVVPLLFILLVAGLPITEGTFIGTGVVIFVLAVAHAMGHDYRVRAAHDEAHDALVDAIAAAAGRGLIKLAEIETADAAAALPIFKACRMAEAVDEFKYGLARYETCLVASVDGSAVGALVGRPIDKYGTDGPAGMAYLGYLAVLRDFRGEGLGSRLLAAFTAESDRAGAGAVIARLAEGFDDRRLARFYLAHGFEPVDDLTFRLGLTARPKRGWRGRG